MKTWEILVAAVPGILAAGLLVAWQAPAIESWIAANEYAFNAWIQPENLSRQLWLLLPAAFLGGLIASLSPCILALLPANMSYIGTLKPASRGQALINASLFAVGVVTILSLFGLLSAFAGAVAVDYRGYMQVSVGLFAIVLGIGVSGLFKIRVPEGVSGLPSGAGPFMVGVAFALVTSPCASPVLFALLATAGSTGVPLLAVGTMVCYALGYTALVFLGSLITGFVQLINRLKPYADNISRAAGILLILVGGYYVVAGLLWFNA